MGRVICVWSLRIEWDEQCGAVTRLKTGDSIELVRGKRRREGRKTDRAVCTSGISCIAMAFIYSWSAPTRGSLALRCTLPLHWSNFSYLYMHRVSHKIVIQSSFSFSSMYMPASPYTNHYAVQMHDSHFTCSASSHIIPPLLRFERLFPNIRE